MGGLARISFFVNATNKSQLLASLDAIQEAVHAAYARTDLDAYAQYLAPELRYVLPNGRTQSRDELLVSLRDQFARLVRFESAFQRESTTVTEESVILVGEQTASLATRIFVIGEVRWRIQRHGRYTWRRATIVPWVLTEVVLSRESVTREGLGLARSPR